MQPQVRVFELGQLAMKFERHLDAEVVDFQILSEDYSKAAFLCADRSICLHAKYGAHYRTRIPHAGRDIAYIPTAAGPNEILFSLIYTPLCECIRIYFGMMSRLLFASAHIATCTGNFFDATHGCLCHAISAFAHFSPITSVHNFCVFIMMSTFEKSMCMPVPLVG